MTVKWHPGDALSAYLDGELSASEIAVVDNHLVSCERCRHELDALGDLRTTVRGLPWLDIDRPFRPAVGYHPVESLTAYLDGEASAEERAGVENHLAACADCAAELAALGATRAAVRDLPWLEAPPLEAIVPPALRDSLGTRPSTTGAEGKEVGAATVRPIQPPPVAVGAAHRPAQSPSTVTAGPEAGLAPVIPMERRRGRRRRNSVVLAGAAAAIAVLGFVGAGVPVTAEPKVQPDLTAFATHHATFAPSSDGVSGAAVALAFAQEP